ncbi:Nif3-like dinuclear metal center hexameric protein [Fibrella aquatica]|uniref:Nif3-like dinuclear metal center hexameric protein n=1 Tax=Fibrella aquatica TaxID=3242487 RepID=UPI00352286DA
MGQPIFLADIADFLQTEFTTVQYPDTEAGGVFKSSDRSVQRIGLALEPWVDIAGWVRSERLDALWLHRPWQLDLDSLPSDVGVLMHHLPFDEHLTTGYNKHLAAILSLKSLEELGYKQAVDDSGNTFPKRPIGMIGNVPAQTDEAWLDQIAQEFGGYERAEPGQVLSHSRVAVVGAMNPALVYEAHERGVSLYLTGEYRKGTQKAVDETGISVIAIGHRRTEEWGVRALAKVLKDRWSELQIITR